MFKFEYSSNDNNIRHNMIGCDAMICLVTCSTNEAAYLLRAAHVRTVTKEGQFTLYVCTYEEMEFLLLLTGYGKVNVGVGLGYAICKYDISMIIGFGDCASTHGEARLIGSITIPTSAVAYDVDYVPLGYPKGVTPCMDRGTYHASKELVKKAKRICDMCSFPSYLGSVVVGERFVAEQKVVKRLKEEMEADYIDSACGAIFQVATMFDIPFIVIQGISNYGSVDAPAEYNNYAPPVLERTCQVVYELLIELLTE